MSYKKPGEVCICEICTCGRHQCPHRRAQPGPHGLCSVTEYSQEYVPHKMELNPSYKPNNQPMTTQDPLIDITTQRADYVEHAIERSLAMKPNDYKPPSGSMEDTTNYMLDYTAYRGGNQPASFKPKNVRRDAGVPFQGEPTYKADFKPWEVHLHELAKSKDHYTPPKDRFQGTPTYKSDYISHGKVGMEASFKPINAYKSDGAHFASVTENRQSYIEHPIEARRQYGAENKWERPRASFEDSTTFKRDYTPKDLDRVVSFKPKNTAQLSNAPLSGDTTMKCDYQPWELERTQLHQADPYKKPDGQMESATTYFNDFQQHPLVRQAMIRKKDRRQDVDAHFDDNTEYKDYFQPWKVERRQPDSELNRRDYVPSDAPFDGISTFKSHYIEHPLGKNESFKPLGQSTLSKDPFKGESLYRSEFTAKEMEVCPAVGIERGSSPEYVFKELDPQTGHRIYQHTPRVEQATTVRVN